MSTLRTTLAAGALALTTIAASAQNNTQVGLLSCDVSKGIGLFVVEKQSLSCIFKPANGGASDAYTGSINQYGVALGAVKEGHLVWGVVAPTAGLDKGALAGKYDGVGANASLGVGAGTNILVGASERAISLQPVSVEGQVGINIACGVTTVTLKAAP